MHSISASIEKFNEVCMFISRSNGWNAITETRKNTENQQLGRIQWVIISGDKKFTDAQNWSQLQHFLQMQFGDCT